MKTLQGLLLSSILAFTSAQAGTLDFSNAGFTIDSLDAPATAAGGQPLQMLLPAQNGFSANVNVQIQPYPGTMAEYMALSFGQFEQMGITKIASREEGDTSFFEYKGALQGQNLHWYAKAVKSGDFVYLVTATDIEQNWESNKQQLMSVVDSFKLK
ncbi:hypothetical protein [Thalassotalea sp. PLHSN55]|uniref:hypothetical protein n=1 Tax=Thalassotalea sp. PLHSN55 TaxID=3435888 RepID=UPI003F82C60C